MERSNPAMPPSVPFLGCPVLLRHDLRLGLLEQLFHAVAQAPRVRLYALRLKVGQHLLQHVVIAGAFEIRLDHGTAVGLQVLALQPPLRARPLAEQPVAPGLHLEAQLLVVAVFGLELLFALCEGRHAGRPLS